MLSFPPVYPAVSLTVGRKSFHHAGNFKNHAIFQCMTVLCTQKNNRTPVHAGGQGDYRYATGGKKLFPDTHHGATSGQGLCRGPDNLY